METEVVAAPSAVVPEAQLNGEMSPSTEHVMNGGLEEEPGLVNGGPSTSTASQAPPPVLTYEDIFPALPGGGPGPGATAPAANYGAAALRPKIRSKNVTTVYRVAAEDLRYRQETRQGDLAKICADIMAKTGTDIQLTCSKDGTMTFLISGKHEATAQAKRLLSSEFQTQTVHQVSIPKEHHRLILGKAGRKLMELEQATGTKIQIPKQEEKSDVIKITGTRESIDKAVHEIQLTSSEAFSRSIERLSIPKIYHPFIVGPFGMMLEQIAKETGAKVNVPPPSVQKDEITITGERNNVLAAKAKVQAIYDEKQKRCQSVSIEVKKPQHKYIVGPKGNTLNEIMQLTGVSVEMPATDSPSETIVLRGEPDKLANALAVLYQKAHSETEDEIEVPGWTHRHILGPKGSKFQELSQEFPKVNVSFETEENRIKMSGPVADVQKAAELIGARAREIIEQLAIEEIKVADPRHIKFIVGKNGANLRQIREETKATIQVVAEGSDGSSSGPPSSKNSSTGSPTSTQYIRIEGPREAVAKAKQELETMLKKLENEVTYELNIERRFFGQIIGAKGEKIRDIRNKFNQVMITFPEPNEQSDRVVIRGAKKDAELCFKHLSQLHKELLLTNFRIEVPIFKQLLQFQGKDSFKKIREDTGCRLDVQSEGDVVVISGVKEKVEKARDRIQAMQSSLSDMSQVDIIIPAKIHNYMLGSKGRNIKQIMAECGGVIITFPPEGSGSDRVNIRGPKDCVAKAKQMLVEMSNDYQTNNYSEELHVRVEHHRYLIGKAGSNINKLREQVNVRVQFASESGVSKEDSDRVIITGKKEEVQKARAILEAKIKELDKVSELEMRVDPKYHHLFVARRAALCKQLYDEYGGVNVSFPSAADKTNDRITLKGPKECLEAVKQRILDIVADFDAQISLEVEIDAVHHRTLLASRANKINALQQEFDVKIKFPARPKTSDATGDAKEESEKPSNIVIITGRNENCEKAKEALLAMVPISEEVSIPYEFHRFVIGQKGAEVRELMDRFNVQIRVPPPADKSDLITVTGTQEAVDGAKAALQEKLIKLEEEKADREARSFQLSFQVDPIYHPKIIGKRGAVITSIRNKYDVQIQVPDSARTNGGGDQPPSDQITIIGYEKNTEKAKEHILKIVQELKDLVTEEVEIDSKIHSRLIGTRGKNIRKIMDQFKVDIRFPRSSGDNPNVVSITGTPENVEECKEHLVDLADTYLDDVEVQYQPPQEHQFQINFNDLTSTGAVKESSRAFSRGNSKSNQNSGPNAAHGPLDTNNAQDFPAFGFAPPPPSVTDGATPNGTVNGSKVAWGPKRN